MILLDREHIDLADKVAIRRRALGIEQDRVQNRGLDSMPALERLMLEVIGARSELAAHLLFKVEWKSAFPETVVRDRPALAAAAREGAARGGSPEGSRVTAADIIAQAQAFVFCALFFAILLLGLEVICS